MLGGLEDRSGGEGVDGALSAALSAALGRLSAGLTFAVALPDLEAALDARGAAVVEAPPGTGKTTVVPPALAVRLADHGGGRVLVTQPRRVAVRKPSVGSAI